jgi:hypothetical protein
MMEGKSWFLCATGSASASSELRKGLFLEHGFSVIPAQAGIQIMALDSRLRGNDGTPK